MSSLYNKDGYIYYSVRFITETGKRDKKAISLRMKHNRTNLRQAKKIKSELDQKYKSIPYRSTNIKLNKAIDLFLNSRRSISTKNTYKYSLNYLREQGSKPIKEVNFNGMLDYLSNSKREHLIAFMKFLHRKGYLLILD